MRCQVEFIMYFVEISADLNTIHMSAFFILGLNSETGGLMSDTVMGADFRYRPSSSTSRTVFSISWIS